MNKDILTARMRESQALDAAINILLIFTALLLAFCVGYYVAMNEALALVKTILN
jgi:hypothetical protein